MELPTRPPSTPPVAIRAWLSQLPIRCAHGSKLPLARTRIGSYVEQHIVPAAMRCLVGIGVPAGVLQLNPYALAHTVAIR